MFYVGILSNKGEVLENDEEAIRYSLGEYGLMPADPNWIGFDYEQFAEHFDLESFFSGVWVTYRSRDEYEAEREFAHEPNQYELQDIWRREHEYWNAEQIRRGNRL